jgi:hypothetical protein
MKPKYHRQCVSVLVVIFCMMKVSLLQSSGLVTGKWECSGDGINGEPVQFVLDLKQSGEQVTGTITYGSNVVDLEKGSIQGNKLEIVVATEDNHYVSTGLIDNDKIAGSWKDNNGTTGKWQGQRQLGN